MSKKHKQTKNFPALTGPKTGTHDQQDDLFAADNPDFSDPFNPPASVKQAAGFQKCHVTHPTLKLGNGELVGAACGSPRPGFDVYVGFDWQMTSMRSMKPWRGEQGPQPVEAHFKITDMSVPDDFADFDAMADWICNQLQDGKKVHMGCIGGHGRTGLVLAVLIHKLMPEVADPIKWVRENHCKKAIESQKQFDWLKEKYGITTTEKPSKESWSKGAWGGGGHSTGWKAPGSKGGKGGSTSSYSPVAGGTIGDGVRLTPVAGARTLFGRR